MSLLITAFGRFDGGPNCSETMLEHLARNRAALEALWGGPVSLSLLPVVAETAEAELGRALATARPNHVLLTGQAAGRAHVSLERVARNRLHVSTPDAEGRVGGPGPVRRGGPETLRATWPGLDTLAQRLVEAGVPARVSDDAGAHLCNQTLYLALEAATRATPRFVATFLHLPLLPEQVAADIPAARRHANCFALPVEETVRAVELILVHTAKPNA